MRDDVLIIRTEMPRRNCETLAEDYQRMLEQMKAGLVLLPFGYKAEFVPNDVKVIVGPEKDEDKVIHNAVTYIVMAAKNQRGAEAHQIAKILYDRAYRKGFEAGLEAGKVGNSDPDDWSGDQMGG